MQINHKDTKTQSQTKISQIGGAGIFVETHRKNSKGSTETRAYGVMDCGDMSPL
jgi:hypothetical protein